MKIFVPELYPWLVIIYNSKYRSTCTCSSKLHHTSHLIGCNFISQPIRWEVSGFKTHFRMVGDTTLEGNSFILYILRYLAPEIMLNLPYSTPVDIWAAGCIMAELLAGKPLFDGKNENDQLKKICEIKGTFTKVKNVYITLY